MLTMQAIQFKSTLMVLGLSALLLAGCGLGPSEPGQVANTHSAAGILPGSKGGIRPSSKGARLELAQVEVELRLPSPEDFQLAQDRPNQAANWSAELDGIKVGKLRLIRKLRIAEVQSLVFVLEASRPLAEAEVHELLFFTPDGVLQAAGLVPELSSGSRLKEALSSDSLASWLVARELMQGDEIQTLAPESLATIAAEAETALLARDLEALYRESKGKADPRKSDKARQKALAAANKLSEKIKKPKAHKTP